jgi:hypothetical protein
MKSILVGILSLALTSATAQELTDRQKAEMAYCALHGGGGWVAPKLYADGKVRFSYLLQPSQVEGSPTPPRDLYVAFWGGTRRDGELLVFNLSKTLQRKDYLTLNNQGWIWDNRGELDVRDALWGMYTYRKLKGLLPRLQKRPLTTLVVKHLQPGAGLCETPKDFDKPVSRRP